MKRIPLTQDKFAIVDDEDYEEIVKFKWCFNVSYGINGYALRNVYPLSWSKPNKVYLHRVIAKAKKGEIVDHINRDTLDNRRENLRITSRRINTLNSKYFEKYA